MLQVLLSEAIDANLFESSRGAEVYHFSKSPTSANRVYKHPCPMFSHLSRQHVEGPMLTTVHSYCRDEHILHVLCRVRPNHDHVYDHHERVEQVEVVEAGS